MWAGYSPVAQAALGTLFTWGLTAAGAALAFVIEGNQRKVLDGSLGFASGVMLAASYWSLLEPAVEMAAESDLYGANGQFAFIPVAVGFFLGAAFVYGTDLLMSHVGVHSPVSLVLSETKDAESDNSRENSPVHGSSVIDVPGVRRRRHRTSSVDSAEEGIPENEILEISRHDLNDVHWRRILLLIIAVTVHNVPEGLAVGVGFGAVGKSKSATFESARNLALGIGIQNFPEGLAVSLPLKAAGFSTWRAIWYGQLSGMVEPIAGILGALLVSYIVPILPYALAFAAGAMIYVVIDDIVPETQTRGNGKIASWGAVIGFLVMMSLDVGLG